VVDGILYNTVITISLELPTHIFLYIGVGGERKGPGNSSINDLSTLRPSKHIAVAHKFVQPKLCDGYFDALLILYCLCVKAFKVM